MEYDVHQDGFGMTFTAPGLELLVYDDALEWLCDKFGVDMPRITQYLTRKKLAGKHIVYKVDEFKRTLNVHCKATKESSRNRGVSQKKAKGIQKTHVTPA